MSDGRYTHNRPLQIQILSSGLDNLNQSSLLLLQPNMYLFEYIDLVPKCQFKVLTFIFFMGCVKWVAFFFHPKVSIALIVLVNLLLFGYSRKDNIISKERRLIREREMS